MVGLKGATGLRNGLCVSFKACTPMPSLVCRSIVSAIMSLAWEFMCIRTLPLAHCSSSRCWRRFHMSSALVYRGSFSTMTTCCSSETPRRSVSPSSRHGRQVWKVESSMPTWRRPSRPSSWSLVLAMLSSRNLASTPVLPALVVSATTQSSAHSACGGSTRSVVASLSNWWPLQTMSVAGVRVRLGLSLAELWMSMAPCLMWKPLSTTYVISCTPVPLMPDVVWPGESSGNSCQF